MNGVLYAMGGYNGNHIATVEAYDPTTDSWTTKTPMPTPRNALGVGSVNGMLYAVGGQSTTVSAIGTNEAYDPATNTWTTKAPMPTPRNGLGVGVVNGVLYAVGGQPSVDAASVLGTVEAYQP